MVFVVFEYPAKLAKISYLRAYFTSCDERLRQSCALRPCIHENYISSLSSQLLFLSFFIEGLFGLKTFSRTFHFCRIDVACLKIRTVISETLSCLFFTKKCNHFTLPVKANTLNCVLKKVQPLHFKTMPLIAQKKCSQRWAINGIV